MHKEYLINENTILTDAMLFSGIQSMTVQLPPEQAQLGDKYIIPTNASGEWNNRENQVAVRLEGRWVFINPRDGAMFWVVDGKSLAVFSNGAWEKIHQKNQ
jgi:hypothetical protein